MSLVLKYFRGMQKKTEGQQFCGMAKETQKNHLPHPSKRPGQLLLEMQFIVQSKIR